MSESPSDQNNHSRRSTTLHSHSLSVSYHSPMINFKSGDEMKDSRQSRISSNALKSRRGVIKMLVVVVLIYFISFSPQVLVFLLFDTNAIRSVPQFIRTPYFIAFTMILVTISSASNPIVYAIFCSKFRQSFAKILRRLYFCSRPTLNCHTNERLRSPQQQTYRLPGKMVHSENKPLMNGTTPVQIKDHNGQQK